MAVIIDNKDIVIERHSPDGKKLLQIFVSNKNNPRDYPQFKLSSIFVNDKDYCDKDLSQHLNYFDDKLAEIKKLAVVQCQLYFYDDEQGVIRISPVALVDAPVCSNKNLSGIAYTTKEKIDSRDAKAFSKEELKELVVREVRELDLFQTDAVYGFSVFDKDVDADGNDVLRMSLANDAGIFFGDGGINQILAISDAQDWLEKENKLNQDSVSEDNNIGR